MYFVFMWGLTPSNNGSYYKSWYLEEADPDYECSEDSIMILCSY